LIVHGDCLEVMAGMEADSFDAVVTDPPYGLGFMNKAWDHQVPGVPFWEAMLRVAKPGAHLLAFGGTRSYHRMACAIEDAEWEIRDTMMWVYGSGFPKSHNGEWGGTALKPAWEPIVVARKPLIGTVAANFAQHGVGGINVDACRVAGYVPSTVQGQSARAGEVYGKDQRDQRVFEPNSAGRWPANLLHDGSDEVVGLFPSNVKGGTWNKTAGARHFNNNGEPTNYETSGTDNTTGSAARFFYSPKASKRDRDEGCEGLEEREAIGGMKATGLCRKCLKQKVNTSGNCQCVEPDFGPIQRQRTNHHPTVKPTELMRYLCKLVTPPNGHILDPFCGSGSTGKAATLEGFNFTGIEQDAAYCEIARARIEQAEVLV
jgi:site-specific DNA-methyltransferase (adenine-specific)